MLSFVRWDNNVSDGHAVIRSLINEHRYSMEGEEEMRKAFHKQFTPNNANHISKFWPITLPNVKLKILTKVLAKRLVLIAEKLPGYGTQTCAIPDTSIQENLYFVR